MKKKKKKGVILNQGIFIDERRSFIVKCYRPLRFKNDFFHLYNTNNVPINEIYLFNKNQTEIDSNWLDDLTSHEKESLQRLYFFCGLTHLEVGVFNSLTGLTYLSIQDNKLKSLPVGIFDQIPNLLFLFLDCNNLTKLDAGIFNGLVKLQVLTLHTNNLETLPLGLFNGLIALEELWLQNNKLTQIESGIFSGLPNLQDLYLNDNYLRTLHEDIFLDNTNLRNIILKNNMLEFLPNNTFNSLTNLTDLNLSNNRLHEIPSLNGLLSLRSLNIKGNYISETEINLDFNYVHVLSGANRLGSNKITFLFCIQIQLVIMLTFLTFKNGFFVLI